MFIFYFLGVCPPCRSIFCQFWLCEEAQCVSLRCHLGSLYWLFKVLTLLIREYGISLHLFMSLFIFSMPYSFQCTGLWPLWLNLLINILLFLYNCKWYCFLHYSFWYFIISVQIYSWVLSIEFVFYKFTEFKFFISFFVTS